MMSADLDMVFAFRCLIKNYPFRMVMLLIMMACVPLSMMLQIIESPVFEIMMNNPDKNSTPKFNNYRYIEDCFWNFFVIITTVGYGDYFPVSNLGRILVVIISLVGIVLVSLIIMTLQNYLKFESKEERSKLFVDRLASKNQIMEEASNYFKTTLAFLVSRSNYLTAPDKAAKAKRSKEIENSLINRLQQKKVINHVLKNFNRDFEPYEPMNSLKSKIVDVEKKIAKFHKENLSLENKLTKIIGFLEK